MASATFAQLIRQCRRLGASSVSYSDAELVTRFQQHQDSAAFAELVDRYAALVWSVCRRQLAQESDCEDAFQATFLSLVRQVHSIDIQRSLGPWLYIVAIRVCRKVLLRQRKQPRPLDPDSLPTKEPGRDDLSQREVQQIIDEEIARLPSGLREPIIFCCLEGRTRDEAAETIGCTVLSLKSRLERGRQKLRERLERRGIQLPLAWTLFTLTARTVTASLKAKAVATWMSTPTPTVMNLALSTGFSGQWVSLLSGLLLVVSISFGSFWMVQTKEESAKQDPPVKQVDIPKVSHLVDRFGDPLPEGAIRRFGTTRFRHGEIADMAFTPDGKAILVGCGRTVLSLFDTTTGKKIRDVGKNTPNNNYGFAISPDGKQVVCCGYNLMLWDLTTGKLIRELGGSRCSCVTFSPDGKQVAAIREHISLLQIRDVQTGKEVRSWNMGDGKPSKFQSPQVAFTPDGKRVLANVMQISEPKPSYYTLKSVGVKMWDVASGAALTTFGSEEEPVASFDLLPKANQIAVLELGRSIKFFDLETHKEVHAIEGAKDPKEVRTTFHFSTDGSRCVVETRSNVLVVFNVKDGKEIRRIDLNREQKTSPSTVRISADGKLVAYGQLYGQSAVRIWDVDTGEERLADGGPGSFSTLKLSADEKTLISQESNNPERAFHWDLGTGKPNIVSQPKKQDQENSEVFSWSRQGSRWKIISNWSDDEIVIQSLDGSKVLGKTKTPAYQRGMAISDDGTLLAASFQDREHTVWVWNPEKEAKPRKLAGPFKDACQQLLFSHDGKMLITGMGTHDHYPTETIRIWDVATGKEILKLDTNSSPGQMLISKDDRTLITGGLYNDALVRIWDVRKGKLITSLADPSLKVTKAGPDAFDMMPAIDKIHLSADERFLAVISRSENQLSVTVWETATWGLVRSFQPIYPASYVSDLLFNKDGRFVFVAYGDTTILQWDLFGQGGKRTAEPDAARLDHLWKKLTEPAERAYPAMWELADHPEKVIGFLKTKLQPIQPFQEKQFEELLKKLESESFRVREEASRQLQKLPESAIPLIEKTLKNKPSAEVQTRLEKVLAGLQSSITPETVQTLRTLAILEWSWNPEIEALFQTLTNGAPSATITQTAKTILQRQKTKN